MARLSKAVFVILNVVVLFLSIGMTATGVSLAKSGSSGCEQWLVKPLIGLGVFLIAVSLFLGITGTWFRNSICLLLYLVFMALAILILLIITFWVFDVTRKGGSRVASSGEYNLGNYSPWLKKRVTEEKNWKSMKTCLLQSTELCSKYRNKSMKGDVNQLSAEKALHPLQSGCCRPPSDCKFELQSPTVWVKSAASSNNTNPDCNSWDNDPKVLCYNCISCKVGMLHTIRVSWRMSAISNIVFLVTLVIAIVAGIFVYLSTRREEGHAPV